MTGAAVTWFELNDGSEVMCSGLFVSDKEFYSVVGSPDDEYPEPYNGGWTFLYTYDNLANGMVEWPEKSTIKKSYSVGHNIYTTILLYDGKTDITDNDNDGLYDIYETTGMRIADGQVMYIKVNNFDTDGDRLKDGAEVTKYNAEKGYFLLSSNPVAVDSDNDGLSDDKDPKPLDSKIVAEGESSESSIKLIGYLNWEVKYKDKFISDMLKLTNTGFKITCEGNDAYISLRKDVNGNIIRIDDNLPEYSKSVRLVEQLMDGGNAIEIKLCLEKEDVFNEDNDTGVVEISYAPTNIACTFIHTGEYYNNRPVGEYRIRPISHTHIALAHEFIHGLHDINGITMNDEEVDDIDNPFIYSDFYVFRNGEYTKFFDVALCEEMFTIGTMPNLNVTDEDLVITENEIRQEHGLFKRLTHNHVDTKTKDDDIYITYSDWVEKNPVDNN